MFIKSQPTTNFQSTRSKTGRVFLTSGAYDASLAIDTLSADVAIGIDDVSATLMVKAGTVSDWGTIAIDPGPVAPTSFALGSIAISSVKTTDKFLVTAGSSFNVQLIPARAYCSENGTLIVSFLNTSDAITATAGSEINWVRLAA